MKKILILLSMMLITGLSFGQSGWTNYIRKHTPCITAGEPSGAPNKYWGCVQAFDTTAMKVWLWNGGSWQEGPTAIGLDQITGGDELLISSDSILVVGVSDSLLIDVPLLTTENDTISLNTVKFDLTATDDVIITATNTVTVTAPAMTLEGTVTLDDVLILTPRADPPNPAAEGMLYLDTDNKVYIYVGAAWRAFTFDGL